MEMVMTCLHCHAPLPEKAYYCPRCGTPIRGGQSPEQQSESLHYYTLNTTTKGSQMFPAVVNTESHRAHRERRRRSAGGCLMGCLTVLVVLLIVIGAGWIFIGRPYAHNIAETQLDTAMGSAVNQIPSTPLIQLIPAGTVVPINAAAINNLIVLNLAPSNPVQKPATTITSQNVTLSFTLYNFPCSISMVPAVSNGRLVAQNVQVNGIFGFIMSSDEMTSLLNKHFSDAQNRLGKAITNVQLKDNAIELTLG